MVTYMAEMQERPQSEYNEAISELKRLNELWTSCHVARKKGNLTLWNSNLDSIWVELSGDEDLTDGEDIKTYNLFNKMISKHKNNKNNYYQILHKKNIFLRALQNRQGKGGKHKEDDDDL